jgi:hypothetical protein
MVENARNASALRDDAEFWRREAEHRGNMVLNLVRERNELRRDVALLVAAAGGEIRVPRRMLVDDAPGVEWWAPFDRNETVYRTVSR